MVVEVVEFGDSKERLNATRTTCKTTNSKRSDKKESMSVGRADPDVRTWSPISHPRNWPHWVDLVLK